MHHLCFLYSLLFFLVAECATPYAQKLEVDQSQAADIYFEAFLVASDAEQLMQAGNVPAALAKYQRAKEMFDSFGRDYPTWQPAVQNMRRQKIADAIASLQVQQATMPAQSQPVPATTPSPATAMPMAPSQPATVPTVPNLTPQPLPIQQVAPTTLSSDPIENAMQTLRNAANNSEQLKKENTELLADIGRYAKAYETVLGQRDQLAISYQALNNTATQQQTQINQLNEQVKNSSGSKAELDAMKQQYNETQLKMSEVQKRLAEREKSVLDQGNKLMEMSVRLESLNTELETTKKEKNNVEEISNKISKEKATAEKQRDSIKKEKETLLAKLEQMAKDRDAATAQLEGMRAQNEMLKKNTPSQGNTKDLELENARLKKELEMAQAQIATLKGDLSKKDAEIANLKDQLGKIQTELSTLKQENTKYQTQVAELTVQLKDTREKMTSATTEKAKPEEANEAQLLRGIIMRQLRLQARQQAQKEAVISEISKMENTSKQLIEQLQQIGDTRITLTADEQKLFTEPQLQEISGTAGIQGTVVAKTTETKTTSPDPTALALQKLVESGNELLANERFEEAGKVYEDILRAEPKNSSGLAGLAWSQMQLNKLEDAEVTLKKAINYDGSNPSHHYMLGVTLFRKEKLTDALSSFEKSLKYNSKNARAHHYLGVICSKLGLATRAETEFKAALAVNPSFADAHYNLAVLFITWDPPRWENARKHYQDALQNGMKSDANIEKLLQEGGAPIR
jgi:Flp pilus assembly protein TadD